VPIGVPIRGSSAYVLDRQMQLQPCGCPGELYAGGTGVARGYVGKPKLTAERFVPHPFTTAPGERLYNTGDIARWRADGTLEFLGRKDNQVKIRGFRVELGEIEIHLSRVPGVRDCVVLARDIRGTGRQLVAYLVASPPDDGTPAPAWTDEIKERCRSELRRRMPAYMVPAIYVVLDRMPVTANGKCDRRSLPAPDESHLPRRDFVPARTATERRICESWRKLLQLEPIGVDDNFFELGGHSLLAFRFLSSMREEMRVEIPMRVLFEKPTIREFATWLDIYTAAVDLTIAGDGEEVVL